jgi:hypothetical protein
MSFTNFYLSAGLSGASDVNAGSTQTGAAAYTSTSGNWSTVTNQFTPTDGSTPASSIAVGDYVSIYVNAATVTTFVAQVTVVAAGANGAITVSSTIIYGTAPTTNSGARSLKAGGTWNSEIVLAATGLAGSTNPQSTKINIKGNLTTTANRTVSMAGTTLFPLWFSGYNTTPGDLDNDTTNTLAKPIWTIGTTFNLSTSGANQLWSGLSVVGNRSGLVWAMQGANTRASRIRVENQSANSAAHALSAQIANLSIYYSWFKAPTTATTNAVVATSSSPMIFVGCVAEGGGLAGFDFTQTGLVFINCVSLNSGAAGFVSATGSARFIGCTISNSVTDGIKWTGTPAVNSSIVGCMFRVIGSNIGINNASGANTNNVFRACNDYYSCSTPESGFGDSPAFFQQTELSDPITSNTNMTPVAGSNAINNGFPGIFENETFSSYPPIGAVTPLASGGASVAIFGS